MQLFAIPDDGKRVTTNAVACRLDYGQCDGGRQCCVDRISAFAQRLQSGFGSQGLRGCHDVLRKNRHSLRTVRKIPGKAHVCLLSGFHQAGFGQRSGLGIEPEHLDLEPLQRDLCRKAHARYRYPRGPCQTAWLEQADDIPTTVLGLFERRHLHDVVVEKQSRRGLTLTTVSIDHLSADRAVCILEGSTRRLLG